MAHRGESIPFGLKEGKPVDVHEVERGLACGCVCPQCKQPLQANNGPDRQFFSHDPGRDHSACEDARETAIHLMAKQIILETQQFCIPELVVTAKLQKDNIRRVFSAKEKVVKERLITFDRVEIEKSRGEITPDVIAYLGEKELIIEIAVTHFVDREKRDKLRKLATNVVEVDLSGLSRFPSKEEIKSLLIGPDKPNVKDRLKTWVSYPPAAEVKARLLSQLDSEYKQYLLLQEQLKQQMLAKAKERAEMMARRFGDLPKTSFRQKFKKRRPSGKNLNIEYKNKAVRHYYCPSPCEYLIQVPAEQTGDVFCKKCGRKINGSQA